MFHHDIEILFLSPRAVIGEIQALLDEGVDIHRPALPGGLARMQQHVFDDRIRTLAVLHDLVEIALQRICDVADFRPHFAIEARASKRLPQFLNELDRDGRKVIDEIERVFDFVSNAGCQLTQRGKFFRLHQTVLSHAQFF